MNFNDFFGDKPVIIAGPCSAETQAQVMATARQLAADGIKIFRAGIWKPRTRPGNFEGVGSVGLEWLKQVKQETGMLVSTEVANVKHVYECLRSGVDILWIGARTSANPFAMQELADSLKGVDIPVFVKNPINPDLELWLGAIERLEKAGIKHIGIIHRGFSNYEKILYRNAPLWHLPVEFKRRRPDLPLIVDPSHISGKRDYLFEISQKALDLNCNGLMIETHVNPAEAWSDAAQQLTPAGLKELISKLVVRKVNPEGISEETLNELRFKIDNLDSQFIDLLKKRMSISEKIGEYKKANNMTVLQPARWDTILNKYITLAQQNGINPDFVTKIFQAIHQESINVQGKVING